MSDPKKIDTKTSLTEPQLADDSMRLRLGLEVDYSQYNLENGDGFGHKGLSLPIPRIEAGVESPIGNNFFGQVNLFVSKGSGQQDVGEGLTSQFAHLGIGINPRIGVALLEKQLRIHAGLDIGLVHVSAEEGSGPQERGAAYAGAGAGKNGGVDALTGLFPMDDWAVNVAGELGISFLIGKNVEIGSRVRLGTMPGVNPVISFEGESSGAYKPSLSIAYLQFGLGMAYRFGSGGASEKKENLTEEASPASNESTEDPALAPPAAEPPQTPGAPAAAGKGAEPAAIKTDHLRSANDYLVKAKELQKKPSLTPEDFRELQKYAEYSQDMISDGASFDAQEAIKAVKEIEAEIKNITDKAEKAAARKKLEKAKKEEKDAVKLANDVLKITKEIHNIYKQKNEEAGQAVTLDFTATAPAMPKPRKKLPAAAQSSTGANVAPAASASDAASSPAVPPPPAQPPAAGEEKEEDSPY